jgi:type IV secretion system protein VirD4
MTDDATSIMIAKILTAPGPVLAASTNQHVWTMTAHARAKVGPIFLFDLQYVSGLPQFPQAWWLNPLATVGSVEAAARLTSHFMSGVGHSDLAGSAIAHATRTLRNNLLAASCGRKTLRDVVAWVTSRSEEPAAFLEEAGYSAQAWSLRSTLSLRTRSSDAVFSIVSTAIGCLKRESLLRWVTPPSTWIDPPRSLDAVVEVNLWSLVTGPTDAHPTVYLLYREGRDSGRPVASAIIGELVHLAVQAASARGGRLDPPVTIAFDTRGTPEVRESFGIRMN